MIERLARWVARADRAIDRARGRGWRQRASDRWTIVPFLGFGSTQRLHVGGRVLRDAGHADPDAGHGALRNLVEFWKRMESDEYPGARVRVSAGGATIETFADDEGHFRATLEPAAPLEPGWQDVDMVLLPRSGNETLASARGAATLPSPAARFGVISDIDDTIVWSNVARRIRMLALLATSNAHTRAPLPGAAALYRALERGAGGHEGNPFFYVSGSPWNLHEPLVEFLRVRGFPRGPLLLRDFGDHTLFAASEHRSHKRGAVGLILATFPTLPVVLIGDSGEQDPEIYAEAVREHPGRVLAVYIRCVEAARARMQAMERLAETSERAGTAFVLAGDSVAAARHAAAAGFIGTTAVGDVVAAMG